MEKVDYKFLRKQVVGPQILLWELAGLLEEAEYDSPKL